VNLTLALNYALGGTDPRGYHAFNLAVHALAALTLFGLARRTLRRTRYAPEALPLALAVSLLWAVHPLLTESVTYVVQRAESLMGFFYLLTLYGFIRSVESAAPVRWQIFTVVACLLGMATKEVMATAPLVVLLYDRTFVAGGWSAALRARWKFYAALAATWLLLGWLVLGAENRGGTAGLGAGDSPWTYALTQSRAIVHYVRLALWPSPLVFDYGTAQITRLGAALPFVAIVLALLAAALIALRRWPAAGFPGAAFFLILAPSSSFVPIAVQPMAEHRMYLPLAAVTALAVLALHHWLRRASRPVFAALVLALGMATIARNAAYRSPVALWSDSVAKFPASARAHDQLAEALAAEGRVAEALPHYEEAIRLEQSAPDSGRTLLGQFHINHGNALLAAGRTSEAMHAYDRALAFAATEMLAHYNLGCVLLETDRLDEAGRQFVQVLKLDPSHVSAHTNLGSVLLRQGRPTEALAHYETALRLAPSAKAHTNVGLALAAAGRRAEAAAQLEAALRLDPDFAAARDFLAQVRDATPR
jgi:tetratricopeptide (TPR) repeat protein